MLQHNSTLSELGLSGKLLQLLLCLHTLRSPVAACRSPSSQAPVLQAA
jgi:hypothetical protein